MAWGRRRAMILSSVIGIIGVSLTMIENFYVLIIGRIGFGVASGSQATLIIIMINEYVPARHLARCMGGYGATQNLGALLALWSGLILPKSY